MFEPALETPFVLLSQDDCPRCERLKLMLERPLRGRYERAITVVHRQSEPERFQTFADAYYVQSTPALIQLTNGVVLTNTNSLAAVSDFLKDGHAS